MHEIQYFLFFFSDAPVRSHLKNVYSALALSLLSASVGAYTHLYTSILSGGGMLWSLAGLGLALGLHFTPDNGKNRGQRMAMLLGFAFLTGEDTISLLGDMQLFCRVFRILITVYFDISGLGLGPLLDLGLRVNPAIVPNAFLMSTAIFASFSGVALFAPDGQYLYLGGTLLSGLSVLFWMGLANLFFQSQLIFQVSVLLNPGKA